MKTLLWASSIALLIISILIWTPNRLHVRPIVIEENTNLRRRQQQILPDNRPMVVNDRPNSKPPAATTATPTTATPTTATTSMNTTSMATTDWTPMGSGTRFFADIARQPRALCDDQLAVVNILTMPDEFELRNDERKHLKRLVGTEIRPVFTIFMPVSFVEKGKIVSLALDPVKNDDDDDEGKPVFYDDVIREYEEFDDLLIIDGVESYSKLPTKVLMAMEFFIENCHRVRYLAKQDIDMVTNWGLVLKRLKEAKYGYKDGNDGLRAPDQIWFGLQMLGQPVIHERAHRNGDPFLSNMDHYPPYASGPFYILVRDLVSKVIEARKQDPRHIINEDAMIGMMLEPLNLKPLPIELVLAKSWLSGMCGSDKLEDCNCKWWAASAEDIGYDICHNVAASCLNQE